ncbi:MAG: hypothetical protein Tsb0020_22150 [Haliangiales bacterium]
MIAVMGSRALRASTLALFIATLALFGGCYSFNGSYDSDNHRYDADKVSDEPSESSVRVAVSVSSLTDLWLPDLPLIKIRRGLSESGYGYEVWFLVGDTETVQFWSRNEIDFGDGVIQHAGRWGMFGGRRVNYPAAITAASAPRIHEAIMWIEKHYRGQAKGGISAMEMFGAIATLGSLAPTGGAASAARTGDAATKALPAGRGVWGLGWAERGRRIEATLGSNLSRNFPVIDRFTEGTITSIKSLDLGAKTYHRSSKLFLRVKRYIDKLARFQGLAGVVTKLCRMTSQHACLSL